MTHNALLLTLALVAFPVAAAQSTDTTTPSTSTSDSSTSTALDPNGDGVVDGNNNGKADTREFPWGLLGLLGLAGLAGLRRHEVPVVRTDTVGNSGSRL